MVFLFATSKLQSHFECTLNIKDRTTKTLLYRKILTSIKKIMLATNTRHTVVKQYLDTKDYHLNYKNISGNKCPRIS